MPLPPTVQLHLRMLLDKLALIHMVLLQCWCCVDVGVAQAGVEFSPLLIHPFLPLSPISPISLALTLMLILLLLLLLLQLLSLIRLFPV